MSRVLQFKCTPKYAYAQTFYHDLLDYKLQFFTVITGEICCHSRFGQFANYMTNIFVASTLLGCDAVYVPHQIVGL